MKIELYKDPNIDGFHSGPRYWIAIDGTFTYFRMDNSEEFKTWKKKTPPTTPLRVDIHVHKVKDLTEGDLMLELL